MMVWSRPSYLRGADGGSEKDRRGRDPYLGDTGGGGTDTGGVSEEDAGGGDTGVYLRAEGWVTVNARRADHPILRRD